MFYWIDMETVTIRDIHLLDGSAYVDKLGRSDVEYLYNDLVDEMYLLGWSIDVWDYDYMDRLDIELGSCTNADITNSSMMRDKFVYDLVHCINDILDKRE